MGDTIYPGASCYDLYFHCFVELGYKDIHSMFKHQMYFAHSLLSFNRELVLIWSQNTVPECLISGLNDQQCSIAESSSGFQHLPVSQACWRKDHGQQLKW